MDRSCPFCFSDDNTGAFSILFEEQEKNTVFPIDQFFVTADIAPLRVGHALIVTKRHETNLGKYWSDKSTPLWKAISVYRRLIKLRLDLDLMAFEHGMIAPTSSKSTCIDHAHVHLVPTREGLISGLLANSEDLELCDRFHLSSENQQYFYYVDVNEKSYVVKTVDYPSQFFRRVYGEAHGLQYWHWRDFVDFPEQLNTRSLYQESLELVSAAFGS